MHPASRTFAILSLALTTGFGTTAIGCARGASAKAPEPQSVTATGAYGAQPAVEVADVQAAPPAPDTDGDGTADREDSPRSEEQAKQPAKKEAPPPAPPGPNTTPKPPAQHAQGGNETAGNGSEVGKDRRSPILIYKADFTMSVYEVQKSIDAVQALAERSNGYLARRDDHSITIRIPAGGFQGVVDDIGKLGDVLARNVSSEDVTAEYRDLEVQLQNSLAMRDRFQQLLEKASKVEDALAIERELGRVTENIERIKGRLKLLADLAQYSTITVRFQPHADQQVQQGPFILPLPWLQNLGLPRLMRL